jgi:DNA invertase Pin-like site-specific DNA recombinase
MIYGYIRVSTDAQDCQNQKIGIEEFARQRGLHINKWIEDQGVSGTKDPRKRNLGKLMKILKTGDHVIASEISRLGRELFMIFRILEFFSTNGISLDTIKDNYHLDSSITSKVLAFAFGMAAQIERDMISKRTIEGLAARKAKGVLLGRPINSTSTKRKLDAKEEQIKSLLQKNINYSAIARILKVHRITVANTVKKRGWDKEYLSDKRKNFIKNTTERINNTVKIKNYNRIKGLTLQELLDLYYEHKGLSKVADSLGVSASTLKTYVKKNNMWEELVALDNQMRLEHPSINQQAKIYGCEKLDLKRAGNFT